MLDRVIHAASRFSLAPGVSASTGLALMTSSPSLVRLPTAPHGAADVRTLSADSVCHGATGQSCWHTACNGFAMNAFSNTAGQDRMLARPPGWRRYWPLALVAVASVGLAVLAYRHGVKSWGTPRVAAERLVIAKAAIAPLIREVNAEGRAVASTSVSVVAPAAGTILWQVQAGDAVKAGQVMGRITSPELDARLVQERAAAESSRADWLRAQADAASQRGAAQAAVATAELELQAAQSLEKRQRVAYEAGASSALQWDAARDQLTRARIQLDQSKNALALKLDALTHEVESRRAAWQRAAAQADELARQQTMLTLKATQSGAIGQRLAGDGATVARDAVLLTLVDLRRLDVQLSVPESLVRELAIGQAGEVMVAGKPVPVTVVALSPEVVNGEVAARLRFDGEQPAELRQNQRLAARVLLERRDAVLSVQRGPFVEQYGGRLAWVVVDGVAHKRAVLLGASSVDRVEIKSGLQAGDELVVSGLESQAVDIQRVNITR